MALGSIFAFFGNLGGPEMLLIVLFVLIFFGAKKLPEIARGLGKGIREFKDASKEIKNEIDGSLREDIPPRKTYAPKVTDDRTIAEEKPVIKNEAPSIPDEKTL